MILVFAAVEMLAYSYFHDLSPRDELRVVGYGENYMEVAYRSYDWVADPWVLETHLDP